MGKTRDGRNNTPVPMTRVQWCAAALAVAYPLVLMGLVLAFRFVGERWWVTGVGLYLPRVFFGTPLIPLCGALIGMRLRGLLWTQALAALVLVVPLMGLRIPWRTAATTGEPVIRVLGYNVQSGHNRGEYDEILREVDRFSPDVVFFVEAAFPETLLPAMRARYSGVLEMNQFVVATRYRIASATEPDKIGFGGKPRSPRFIRVLLETPLGPIVVYVVHPISPREALYSVRGVRKGILGGRAATAFYDNNGLRELQVATFAEAVVAETGAVLVVGDTNLPELSFVLDRYLSKLQDGFASTGAGFGYTFPTDKVAPWMRIDRIMANDALRFVSFEVGTSDASDHRCVVADLQARPVNASATRR